MNNDYNSPRRSPRYNPDDRYTDRDSASEEYYGFDSHFDPDRSYQPRERSQNRLPRYDGAAERAERSDYAPRQRGPRYDSRDDSRDYPYYTDRIPADSPRRDDYGTDEWQPRERISRNEEPYRPEPRGRRADYDYGYYPEPEPQPDRDPEPERAEKPQRKGGKGSRNAASARDEEAASASTQRPEKKKEKAPKPPKPPRPQVAFRDTKVGKFLTDKRFLAVLGVLLVFGAVYISVAALSFFRAGAEDESLMTSRTYTEITSSGAAVSNSAGPLGAKLAQSVIVEGLGLGSVALVVYLVLLGLSLMGLRRMSFWSLTFKTLLVAVAASLVMGLVCMWTKADINLGGYHGLYINQWLVLHADWVGAALVSAFALVTVFYVYINDIVTVYNRYQAMRRASREKAEQARYEHEQARQRVRQAMEEADRREREQYEAEHPAEQPEPPVREREPIDDWDRYPEHDDDYPDSYRRYPDDQYPPQPAPTERRRASFREYPDDDPELAAASPAPHPHETYMPPVVPDVAVIPDVSGDPVVMPAASTVAEVTSVPMEIAAAPAMEQVQTPTAMVVETHAIEEAPTTDMPELYDPTAELSRYQRPPLELLADRPVKENCVDLDEQEENQQRIRKTLNDYGIEISKIKATVGPTVTLYEIIPAEGVRIAKIKRLEDDIALSLSALGIRIIAPMPGKGTIGIEVPNKDPQTVSIRSILGSKRFQEGKEILPMAMGATISNEVFVADLCKMPHLLVAGATGMGKSVGLNAIIASLLYKRHPAELKFVLIDPKMVEFSLYSVLERHFLAKLPDEEEAVVTQMDKVLATLNSLCVEMDNRLQLLRDANVRSISEYNEKFTHRTLNPENGHRFLPYIVVIIDEFADLIMTAGKEVEKPVARIAQKARAVGIHMIVATQRPSTDVITGLIKNNFPGRIAFRVTQMVDSKTILDRPGANQLIGRGDMLFLHNGGMTRVQCAFIDTPEVQAICDHIDNQIGYDHAYYLPEPQLEGDGGGSGSGALTDRDSLFNEVAELVVQTGLASTSSVQRRYAIGYNRAGKIMDQLEAAGIVGPSSGGKPRQVLVDPMRLRDILNTLE